MVQLLKSTGFEVCDNNEYNGDLNLTHSWCRTGNTPVDRLLTKKVRSIYIKQLSKMTKIWYTTHRIIIER